MNLYLCETSEEYVGLTNGKHLHPYNGAQFAELNRTKCEKIHYLIFQKNGKARMSIVLGETNNIFSSPFSAPFGGFDFYGKEPSVKTLNEAVGMLCNFLRKIQFHSFHITFPPLFYQQSFLSKCVNVFYSNGFDISKIDINHAYALENFSKNSFLNKLQPAARNKFRKSEKENFIFSANNNSLLSKVYEIIKNNRASKNYPLHLSLNDIHRTSKIIETDSFSLSLPSQEIVASAFVYRIHKNIAQVIYWGNDEKFNSRHPMNYLAYKIFEFYAEKKFQTVDIGPSSSDSIPNYGLAYFKESIGCDTDLKFTMKLSSNE